MTSRLSANSSYRSGRSRKRSSESRLPSLVFILVMGLLGLYRAQLFGACSSLQSETGPEKDKSCNVDVDDEFVPVPDDNTGTTRGAKLSVSHIILNLF